MKSNLPIYLCILFLLACTQHHRGNGKLLKARIDSLQKMIDSAYRPGLGEFMSSIQLHHEKLWFAGKNANWKLAAFEINEIREDLTDINSYCSDRPETHFMPMIIPPLDSLAKSIQEENSSSFKLHFMILTNTCNSCHQATKHEFNVIRVPATSSFPDQVFEPGAAKK